MTPAAVVPLVTYREVADLVGCLSEVVDRLEGGIDVREACEALRWRLAALIEARQLAVYEAARRQSWREWQSQRAWPRSA